MLRAGCGRPVGVALLAVSLAFCPLAVTQVSAATEDRPPGEAARTIAASRRSAEAELAERAISIILFSTGLPVLDGSDLFEVQGPASWDLDVCEWDPVSEDPAAEDGLPVEMQDAALWSSRPAIAADALVP